MDFIIFDGICMVAASILPVTWIDGQLHFLFGKENELEDSAKGFSDFGGGVESGESILDTAFREGAEELCGFLGDAKSVKRLVRSGGGFFPIVHHSTRDGKPTSYTMHLFYMKYDPAMLECYNRQHAFLWNRMDKHFLNKSKLFEKQEIRWFSAASLRRPAILRLFRGFYRQNIRTLLSHLPEIERFMRAKHTRSSGKKNRRVTRRRRI